MALVSVGWPEQPENRIGVGAHATPEVKAFRGLLDKHSESIRGARRTFYARPMQERRRLVGIDQVVGERFRGKEAMRP
jgi:hypothetical protein